jgi:hypothetical protein
LNPTSTAEGEAMKEEIGADGFAECSALTQQGLKKVFDTCLDIVLGKPEEKKLEIIRGPIKKTFEFEKLTLPGK